MDANNPFEGIKTYDDYRRLWALTAGLVLLHFPVVVLVVLVERLFHTDFTSMESMIPVQLVIGAVAIGVLSGLGVSWRDALADWRRRFASDAVKSLKYFGGYLLVLAGVVALVAGGYLLFGDAAMDRAARPMLSQGAMETAMIRTASASAWRLPLTILSACFLAPVVEELFFRRIFYTTVRARNGFWFSAFWSGLFFALGHGWAAPALLPVGIYFCWVYERERRLPVNIMLHSLVNVLMVAVRLNL